MKLVAVSAFLLTSLLGLPSADAGTYSIIDLGTLGSSESYAYGINASGQVVGYAIMGSGDVQGFLYDHGTMTMTDLGTLGPSPYGFYGDVQAINASGQVVGQMYTGTPSHAFLYDNGTMTDLGSLGRPWDINDSGQVVGGDSVAYLYDLETMTMTELGTLGGSYGGAQGINNSGQIVGYSYLTGDIDSHAFLYDIGTMTMTDLGTLGGLRSYAWDINDSGQVVGTADIGSATHAFVYDSGTMTMTDLGTLGGLDSWALALNASGQIVGGAFTTDNAYHAFVYDNGNMTDLNPLLSNGEGWEVNEAWDINTSGQIVGWGIYNGQYRAFLLTPDPVNSPPVADAGADQSVHCDAYGGAEVLLDGSFSDDPDGDDLRYEWSVAELSGIVLEDSTSQVTAGLFKIGVHEVTLTVYDVDENGADIGGVNSDSVLITVYDDDPPVALVTTDVASLWPPNGEMIPITIYVEASDYCTAPNDLDIFCYVSSNQPDNTNGDGNRTGDVNGFDGYTEPVEVSLTNVEDGLYEAVIWLRAERASTARTYSIGLSVEDSSGNTGEASTTVVVPHDRRRN